eukprot:522077-Pyramimonas_sp.AAC.1
MSLNSFNKCDSMTYPPALSSSAVIPAVSLHLQLLSCITAWCMSSLVKCGIPWCARRCACSCALRGYASAGTLASAQRLYNCS